MASSSDGSDFTEAEISGLTDAELVERSRAIDAELQRRYQDYMRSVPVEGLQAIFSPTGFHAPGSEPDLERRRRVEAEIELRLGEMLRGARLSFGLTLRDVGRVAGLHSKLVEEIERGRRPWLRSPDFFERACTEGRLGPADCSPSLSVWSLLADPRICRTIREVTVDSAWLNGGDGAVATLSRSIREDRTFDLLPILADALEEEGCTDQVILAHCRDPGEHARGCWVVDALTRAGRRE